MNEHNRMNDFGNIIKLFFLERPMSDLLVIREINTELTGLRLDK